jgi:DNA topoisomerase IA
MTIQPRSETPEERTPVSGKRVMIVVDKTKEEKAKPKQPTTIQTLKEKKSRPYSFLRRKTVQIFEQVFTLEKFQG